MRFYRLLLHLFPASFRAEYEEEMCSVFARRYRCESAVTLWAETLADLVVNALRMQTDVFRQDLQWAVRTLRSSPGFTFTALAVIALGIGANAASFTLLDYVLLRPLPFMDPGRLVTLHEVRLKRGALRELTSPPNFLDWSAMSKSFSSMGAYLAAPLSVNLSGRKDPVRLDSSLLTSEVFTTLGIKPAAGRVFTPDDDLPGSPEIVILSYSIALSLFGTPEAAVGKTVRLDDAEYTIVGVMPPEFAFPSRQFELWRPLRFSGELMANRSNHILFGLARLRPEVSLATARAEMNVVAEQLRRAYPKDNSDAGIGVEGLREVISPQARILVIALFGAAFCLLLIGCMNLANLLLARTISRRREIAVRIAIGAGRERVLRQVLTESLTLAVLGGTMGLALAWFATPLLSVLVPAELPVGAVPKADWRVFTFAVALTLTTSIVFGVGPAARLSRTSDLSALRSRSAGAESNRWRSALVLAEVTGTMILLISTGLLVKALWRVQAINPGFRSDGVLTLRTALPSPKYDFPANRRAFYSRVLNEVRALPGVSSAAYVSYHPLEPFSGRAPVMVPGLAEDPIVAPRAVRQFVTPGFFATLGIPLRRGRDISDRDTESAPGVAVISESLAQRLWPGEDPIGRAILADGQRTVVGVAAEIAVRRLEGTNDAQIYYPAEQMTMPSYYWPKDLLIHTSGNPVALAPAARNIIHAADPEQAISGLQPLEQIVASQTASRRAQLGVLGSFAGIAFLLAAVGIHGLLSFTVTSRTQEVGVRIALGAKRREILAMFLRQGALLGVLGVALAVPLGYLAASGMESLLFGVRPSDPLTYAAAAGLALAMTLAGSFHPAWQASSIDPAITIRTE